MIAENLTTDAALPPAASFFPQRPYNPGAALCFVHVAKAAGTTLRLMMENAFPGELTYPSGSPAFRNRYVLLQKAIESGDDLQRYQALSGHFGAEVAGLLAPEANLFTWLREPADRAISEFSFSVVQERQVAHRRFTERLGGNERLETVFLDWLLHMGPNFHRQQAQLVFGGPVNYDAWRETHPDLPLTDAALAALRRVFFIGLVEDQERAIDAFSALTSTLPPRGTHRRNSGANRPHLLNFTAEEQGRFDAALAPDRAFYRLAREIYDRQMANLAARARTEPALALIGNREALRDHLLKAAAQRAEVLSTWTAWDPVLAENLDGREEADAPDGGKSRWRWTGHKPDTFFHFALPRRRAFELRIRLNPATPPEHAAHVTLRLAGKPMPMVVGNGPDARIDLVATVSPLAALRLPELAELHLHTARMLDESKLVPYAGTRMLGLAIESITARPISLREYLWQMAKRSRAAHLVRRIRGRLRRGL